MDSLGPQVTQMVHLLPHERMDLYRKSVGKLESMRMTILQEKCVCKKDGSTKVDGDCEEDNDCEYKCEEEKSSKEEKEKCMWPSNHEDKITLKEKGEIRKLPIVS